LFHIFKRGITTQTIEEMQDVRSEYKQICSLNIISIKKTEVNRFLGQVMANRNKQLFENIQLNLISILTLENYFFCEASRGSYFWS
jgi:hypothetical protein